MDFFINAAVLGIGPMSSNTMKMGLLSSLGVNPEAGISFSGIEGANYADIKKPGGKFGTYVFRGYGHEGSYTTEGMEKFGKTRSFLKKGIGKSCWIFSCKRYTTCVF